MIYVHIFSSWPPQKTAPSRSAFSKDAFSRFLNPSKRLYISRYVVTFMSNPLSISGDAKNEVFEALDQDTLHK